TLNRRYGHVFSSNTNYEIAPNVNDVDEMELVTASHAVFRGEDFYQWLRRITAKARAKGWEASLKDPKGGTKDDQAKAFKLLINHLDNSVLRLVEEEENPCRLIRELKHRYGEADSAMLVQLRSKLANTKISDFRSAQEYVNEISATVVRIQNAGEHVTNEQHYSYLLQGLSDQYENVRMSAAAVLHCKKADPDIARSLILQIDQRPQPRVNEQPCVKEQPREIDERSKGAAMVSKFSRDNVRCYRCN
ncbi:hypothetical protein U1Q18_052271, partial [Sarracenia purpurea var. burkii]